MECGIIGLPGCGKTALFCALTGCAASALPGGGVKPHIGVARIPDPRLDIVAKYLSTRKVVPATIQFVDLPGVPADASAARANAFLSHVRQVEAICHVVDCFGEATSAVTVHKDIESLQIELILADLQVAESSLRKTERPIRAGDKEAKARADLLLKVLEPLNDSRSIPPLAQWPGPEKNMLKNYGMITVKPVLYVANVAENDLDGSSEAAKTVVRHAQSRGAAAVVICAALEAELAELDEPDRAEMLGSLGLTEPAIGPLARAVNEVLGLTSFYTANDKEIRAWTIPAGATAPEAAGVVHSDMQRGFIRAECFAVDDLERYHDEKAIRAAGKLRSEGKHYHVQDGEVIHFLFNV